MRSIAINELSQELLSKNIFVDVRSPAEFSKIHAEGAVNVPLDLCAPEQFEKHVNITDAEHIYIICQSGNRARMACDKLMACEFAHKLCIVDGGTEGWQRAGREIIRGKGMISVERQVRIAAGFLVALGVALGYWVHPGFLGISGFVGIGLMFAGITDFCGMGLVLARMPWNTCGTTCCVDKKVEEKE